MRQAIRGVLLSPVVILVTVTMGLSGCGNVLVENRFSVTIEDPGGRLAPGPVEVSVFDSMMGSSDEWARRSMGTATATVPYTTSFQSTATKFIGDNGPSQTIAAGLALPGFKPKGYFALNLRPIDGQTTTVAAPFVGYYDYEPARDGPVAPLVLTFTSTARESQWQIRIQVRIPASR